MTAPRTTLTVLQHTDGEFLGLLEDHLEGRNIRFRYVRPHSSRWRISTRLRAAGGLVLLGGGDYGAAGVRDLPTLAAEVALARDALERDLPVIGIGLGAQILALAGGGGAEPGPLVLAVEEVRRVRPDALNGYLPERWPQVVFMRDRPRTPPDAEVLALDEADRPALFRIGARGFGFTGHPGAKLAMVEDLIMELEDGPEDPGPALAALREQQHAIADALVRMMTGLVQITGLMGEPPAAPAGPGESTAG